MPPPSPFRVYVRELRDKLDLGNATEHTHRPALERLLEAADRDVEATNEPQHIDCGAPDFVVTKKSAGHSTIGYVEAKDIGVDLSAIERDSDRRNPSTPNGQQLRRYRDSLPNLVLTNYTEFRWYVDRERLRTAQLAEDTIGGLTLDRRGEQETRELLTAFYQRPIEPVGNAHELAERMARISHMIRSIVGEGFKQDQLSQGVRDLYAASKQALVPDLAEDTFADMFAQTLAYGLFAARVNHASGPFRWQDAAHDIPAANPFIRQVFAVVAGPDLRSEPFASFVDDLAQLLGTADLEAVLADFGRRGVRLDPIMHFYETFLAAYDPALRKGRGVYYTPEPVISYIVRSVDHLLREQFDCREGLADHEMTHYSDHDGNEREAHRVLVLDPACGTGSFLYAVVDHIRDYYEARGRAGMWRGYVKEHLLPRLFGFELLMAAYAMAHLKLGMQLAALDMPQAARADWAYPVDAGERLGVYLTNTLEPGEDQAPTMFGPLRALTAEARAAASVKRDLPIMVVLGNPPYSGSSANESRRNGTLTWIGKLIEDYKIVDGLHYGEKSRSWLQDDYVKFIRFGQWRIQQSRAGILAFITNHRYLNNPTFRGMRQQLMDAFTDIYVLDLHGSVKLRERTPDGGVDENVFDIQQGVAIGIFVKEPGKRGPARVRHADLWGEQEGKYAALAQSDITTTTWEELEPASPNYLFQHWATDLESEYGNWPRITEIMSVNSTGVLTARDKLTVQHTSAEMMKVVRDFAVQPPEIARSKYRLRQDAGGWTVQLAQDDLNNSRLEDRLVTPILYRPFDTRYTFYTGNSQGFIWRPRKEVMRHMISGSNIGMSTTRSLEIQGGFEHVFISRNIVQHHTVSLKEVNYLFPLYLYPSEQEIEQGLYQRGARRPNFDPKFTAELAERLGLEFVCDGRGDLESSLGPEDVFHYIYAVLHSRKYRERYAQFLRADFARVPSPSDLGQFRALASLGRQLTGVHLLEVPVLDAPTLGFPVPGDNVVQQGHPKYVPTGTTPSGESEPVAQGRVYINTSRRARGARPAIRGQYFDGIAPEVWEFRIGGYQPLHQWLKDRKGRELSFDDLHHYGRIAAAQRETIRLMAAIDEVGLPFPSVESS